MHKRNKLSRRRGLWLLMLIAATGLLLTALLSTANLGFVKPQVESWLRGKTGRDFLIKGDLDLYLGRKSMLRAANISLANAEWATSGRPMLEIEYIEIHLDLWSVFRGPVIVERVALENARLVLENARDRPPNWDFGAPAPTEDVRAKDGKAPGVRLHALHINALQIDYLTPDRPDPLQLMVESLRQERRPDDHLDTVLTATLNDRVLTLEGQLGTWENLLAGTKLAFDLRAQLDTLALTLDGHIDRLSRPRHPVVNFTLKGPDIDDLTLALGLGDHSEGDIDLAGSLTGADRGPATLRVKGNVGSIQMAADGVLSGLDTLDEVDLEMRAAGPNLGRYLAYLGIDDFAEAPFEIALKTRRRGPVLDIQQADMRFGQSTLTLGGRVPKFPSLDDAALSLNLRGDKLSDYGHLLRIADESHTPFSLSANIEVLEDGSEAVRGSLITALASAEFDGKLQLQPGAIGGQMRLRLTSPNLAILGKAWGIARLPARPATLSGNVALVAGGYRTLQPIAVDIDGLRGRIEGFVATRPGLVGSTIRFSSAGPKLPALAQHLGIERWLPQVPYDIAGELGIEPDAYRLRRVAADLGSAKFIVEGRISRKAGVDSELAFSGSGEHLEEILAGVDEVTFLPGAFTLDGRLIRRPDVLVLRDIVLERGGDRLAFTGQLARPLAQRRGRFSIAAKGGDIRSLVSQWKGIKPDAAPYRIDANARWRDGLWSFTPLDIALGDASLQAHSRSQKGAQGWTSEHQLNGHVPNLAALGTIHGQRPRQQSLRFSARLRSDKQRIIADPINLTLGDDTLAGRVSSTLSRRPRLQVEARAAQLRLQPFFAPIATPPSPAAQVATKRRIPEIALPLEQLRAVDGSVQLEIDEFSWKNVQVWDARINATLENGELRVPELRFRGNSGWLQANAQLTPQADQARASLNIEAQGLHLDLYKLQHDRPVDADIHVALEGFGSDTRALAASANGTVLVHTRGGRLPNHRGASRWFGSFFDELISDINPFYRQDEFTDFDCMVIPLAIADGKLEGKPNMVVQTQKIRFFLRPRVNLQSEKLTINIRSTPRRRFSLSAGEIFNPHIKVTGTLAKPRIELLTEGTAISGGAAVATGGLSILARAAWERLVRSSDPCGDTARQARALFELDEQ